MHNTRKTYYKAKAEEFTKKLQAEIKPNHIKQILTEGIEKNCPLDVGSPVELFQIYREVKDDFNAGSIPKK